MVSISGADVEILKVQGLNKSFGQLVAVAGVDLRVKAGEVRAIIGPNGAGKTTFFNLISGDLKPTGGNVSFKQHLITGLAPHRIARLGIARSFQITNIYNRLTLFENVMVTVLVRQGRQFNPFRSAKRISEVKEDTLRALRLVGLENLSEMQGLALSHGDKKRLEIAMALASRPELLLLDEPTAGMSPEETQKTVQLIRKVSSELGITIVFTEHDMKVVFSISDSISVLQQGRIIAEGCPDEVKNNKKVIEAYIGEAVE
jgi:branched-chain amino acid transport system ATP-binding protein